MSSIETELKLARNAFYQMAQLRADEKNRALMTFAQLVESHADQLLKANQQDLTEQSGKLIPALYQRLKLDEGKLTQVVQGIRDVATLPDPVGKTLAKTLLDEGLLLEKRSVPLGVIAIIFESRPDVVPQILSLILKSGNAVVLKGGQEAHHSNRAFMDMVTLLNEACPFLPAGWATLLLSREAVHELLKYPQYVDLVIPRGSNQLVQAIMAATSIPVLGHADGVCHLYVHSAADPKKALMLVMDAKTQYPAACNALETLLIDTTIAEQFLPQLQVSAQTVGLALKGCEETCKLFPQLAPVENWHTEYGDLTLAVRMVKSVDEAIVHINQYGSHHTDGIVTEDLAVAELFLNAVDSANVYVNASTRFADGFRYGFGAEIGISTSRTHARGPVGLDGLVTYKYRLEGQGHIVADYTGKMPKRQFLHQFL